jgi:hypothetical protein
MNTVIILNNTQAFFLGFFTVFLFWLIFYVFSIYIQGVNENYNSIFCDFLIDN